MSTADESIKLTRQEAEGVIAALMIYLEDYKGDPYAESALDRLLDRFRP